MVAGLSYYIQRTWVKNEKLNQSLRIQKGTDVMEGEYPYVVLLAGITPNKEFYRVASGSLITENWVLTSAHIFSNHGEHANNTLVVWFGKFTESPFISKQYSEVLEIVKHPAFHDMPFITYELFNGVNDIALLRVHKISIPVYGKLSSVDHTTLIGLSAVYVGGGETDKLGSDLYRVLQVGHGMVIKCGPPVSSWSPYLLCITPPCSDKKHIPIIGDSGSPFLIDGKIVGTFSVRYFTFTHVSWTAFSPVDLYLDWINDVIVPKED
ncbi:hypothetical protein HF086_006508 [Spodoptera exigua]|uniref:Peptidase S1 domain-containing protein n=1 Tax=Spodoptera exigua TaxID=7107 RepID=A0A922SIK6_SPOEX|nr:hypothetical protein HF086_006508 [Spodoptera exigua]